MRYVNVDSDESESIVYTNFRGFFTFKGKNKQS